MRIKIFVIAGLMGLAVISGIIRGLSSPRSGPKKEEEEKAGETEGRSGEKAGL